jgi:hypothetical protein
MLSRISIMGGRKRDRMWARPVVSILLVSQTVADTCALLSAISREGAYVGHFDRVRGGGTASEGSAGHATQTIVGVGIGLAKSGTSGHVVRRLAAGFPAAESRQIFIKVTLTALVNCM